MALLDKSLLYTDGRLFSPMKDGRMAALRGWPDPGAWVGRMDWASWLPWRSKIGMVEIERMARFGPERSRDPCAQLLSAIPPDVGQAVVHFPEYAFGILKLTWQEKRAVELVSSAPSLAFAITVGDVIGGRPFEEMAIQGPKMSVKKRVEIAGWLGFPATRGAVRILERVSHSALRVREIHRLREILQLGDPKVLKLLAHVPRVNPEVIGLVRDPELLPSFTASFLAEACEINVERPHLARGLRQLVRDYAQYQPQGNLPAVDSLDRFHQLQLTIAEAVSRRRRYGVARFPAPPLSGTDAIEPITDITQLIDEGILQRNCVADLASSVRTGRIYVYRVLAPERCTLSIAPWRGRWQVDQLYRACNQVPSAETKAVVRDWLQETDEGGLRPPTATYYNYDVRTPAIPIEFKLPDEKQYQRLSVAQLPSNPWWKAIWPFRKARE